VEGADRTSAGVWQIRLSTLLWAVLVVVFLLGIPVLADATWLALPALLLLALSLAVPLVWVWRRVWRHARLRPWIDTWLRGGLGLWFLLCGLVAAPVYALAIITETRPAIVPTVTLTNGARTVVLQGMQHVGADRFFQAVVYDLERALADGYVLAYEGVAPSDPEADAWFRTTLSHGKDLGDSYRELGKTCGLSYQIDFFGPVVADAKAHPDRHVTMDVTTRDMKHEYDRLLRSDAAFAAAARRRDDERTASEDDDDASGILSWFIERQRAGDTGQAALAGTLCRGLMTFVMQRSAAVAGTGELDPVVLAFRNERLVARLLADPRDKIYVTYGAAHIPGVLERLRRQPGWTVQSVKWMRTIAAPEHLEGGRL
jgi:signal transduction histidine kinase